MKDRSRRGDGPNSVNIQNVCSTNAKSVFHGSLLARTRASRIKPVRVDGTCSPRKDPRDSSTGVCLIYDLNLGCNLGIAKWGLIFLEGASMVKHIRDVSTSESGILADDVEVYLDSSGFHSDLRRGDFVSLEVRFCLNNFLIADFCSTSESPPHQRYLNQPSRLTHLFNEVPLSNAAAAAEIRIERLKIDFIVGELECLTSRVEEFIPELSKASMLC